MHRIEGKTDIYGPYSIKFFKVTRVHYKERDEPVVHFLDEIFLSDCVSDSDLLEQEFG